MTRTTRSCSLAAWAVLAFACSSDHAAVLAANTGAAAGTGGGRADGGGGAGGAPADAAVPSTGGLGAGAAGSRSAFGDVVVEDVEAGSCAAPGGASATVASVPELGTGFARVGLVGARRFAYGAESSVLMTFAPDASAASPVVAGLSAAAASGASLAGLLQGPSSVELQFYDEMAMPSGAAIPLSDVRADAVAVAVGPSRTLAVYRVGGSIIGKIVASGAVTASLNLGASSGGEGRCANAAVWDGAAFAVLTTARLHNGRTKTTWTHIASNGKILFSNEVFLADDTHVLFDLVPVPSGYAALFGEGSPTKAAVVVMLDEFGFVVPPVHRLAGTSLAWGLASNGADLAVAAQLEDGRAALRAFDSAFAPLGPWVCVDDSKPRSRFYAQAGVSADDAGWGIVARMTDLSVSYRRTDRIGTGAPVP